MNTKAQIYLINELRNELKEANEKINSNINKLREEINLLPAKKVGLVIEDNSVDFFDNKNDLNNSLNMLYKDLGYYMGVRDTCKKTLSFYGMDDNEFDHFQKNLIDEEID